MSRCPAPASLSIGSQNPTTSMPCFLKSAIVWSRKRAFRASSLPGAGVYVRSSKTRTSAANAPDEVAIATTATARSNTACFMASSGLHVRGGILGRLLGGPSLLARDHVGGVPPRPVVLRGGRFVRPVALLGLYKKR